MSARTSPAIADYDLNGGALALRWSKLDPLDVHAPVLHLFPSMPCRVIDIGAGAGGDADWLAGQGHSVLAVEPADGLRLPGMAMYPSPRIEWLKDALPDLSNVLARNETFDFILMSAVWAHLDHDQRRVAIPNLARLMAPGGRLILSIRNGWTPPTRPTFEAKPEETIAHAEARGLTLIFNATHRSVQDTNRANGVTWTRLAFDKPAS
jgi:SAM-dependent methyltransferase